MEKKKVQRRLGRRGQGGRASLERTRPGTYHYLAALGAVPRVISVCHSGIISPRDSRGTRVSGLKYLSCSRVSTHHTGQSIFGGKSASQSRLASFTRCLKTSPVAGYFKYPPTCLAPV